MDTEKFKFKLTETEKAWVNTTQFNCQPPEQNMEFIPWSRPFNHKPRKTQQESFESNQDTKQT